MIDPKVARYTISIPIHPFAVHHSACYMCQPHCDHRGVCSGRVVILTRFLDGDTPVSEMRVRVFYV